MKKLMLALAVTSMLALSTNVRAADEKEERKGPAEKAVATFSDEDTYFIRRGKDGHQTLVSVPRKVTKEQFEALQKDQKDGDTKANASLPPGANWGRDYLGTLPHVLMGRALEACRARGAGYAWVEVTGYSGAWTCWGIGYYRPFPIPQPQPWPYPVGGADK